MIVFIGDKAVITDERDPRFQLLGFRVSVFEPKHQKDSDAWRFWSLRRFKTGVNVSVMWAGLLAGYPVSMALLIMHSGQHTAALEWDIRHRHSHSKIVRVHTMRFQYSS